MNLIKTSFLNGFAVFIKMFVLLSINKVLAIYIGPSGYAIVGQLQNAIQVISTVASGAISNGVIKYTAEYSNTHEKEITLWRTAGSISLITSLSMSFLVIFFDEFLAEFFLKDRAFASVFFWLGISLTPFVINNFFLAVLNGKKEIKKYIFVNISGSIFALFLTIVLTHLFNLYGAMIAFATYQALSFFVSSYLVISTNWFKLKYFIGKIDKNLTKKLFGYTIMSLTSAFCVPACHLFIRNDIGSYLGWQYAGYWEAMWRLSSAYLMFITTTLSVYYLPKLSELVEIEKIKQEIIQGYRLILPFTIGLTVFVFLFRANIISILFTKEFIKMESLFFWHLIGDVFKIGSWLLSYVMVSKAMVKLFVFTEVFFSIFLCFTLYFSIRVLGFEGASLSHAVTYFFYWLFLWFVIKKLLERST